MRARIVSLSIQVTNLSTVTLMRTDAPHVRSVSHMSEIFDVIYACIKKKHVFFLASQVQLVPLSLSDLSCW